MNKFLHILLAINLVCASVSCQMSEVDEWQNENIEQTDDRTLSFSVRELQDTQVGATRASAELNSITIHYGYIFYFDSAKKLVGSYFVDKNVDEIVGNGSANPSFMIDDNVYKNSYKIVCVFNYDNTSAKSNFDGLTPDNVSDYFPMSADFLLSVQNSHNGGTDYTEGGGTRYDVGMPMSVNDFTDSDNSTHEIYRSLARMSLAVADGLVIPHESHEHEVEPEDLSYALVNYAESGAIEFNTLEGVNPVSSTVAGSIYNGVDELDFKYTPNLYVEGADFSTTPKTYLFEFPYSTKAVDGTELQNGEYDTKRFAIIIAHRDEYSEHTLYYKLNLVDKIQNIYYDVERNHDYRIVIKSIYSRGYESLEEAYLMPPSNIEYEIYDDQGDMTYSNGQYAISMDEILNYDEINIYGHSTVMVNFDNIKYILPEQMHGIDVEDMTNSVLFDIVSVDESKGFTAEAVLNDFEDNPKLTAEPRSIHLKVDGEGSCVIQFIIKLGNLEIGRNAIKIIKGADDGALDAHPVQIPYEGIEIDPKSWRSESLDFGAWFDAEKKRSIVYMGDNAIPTGYKSMDGYISSKDAKDSYPIFSEKERTAYYSYRKIGDEHFTKAKIMAVQLPPAYLGHFGDKAAEGSHTYYNSLVVERIEEIKDNSWKDLPYGGVMPWSNTAIEYYDPLLIYSAEQQRYLNLVEGLIITKYIVENTASETNIPYAALYCYYKNDVNGNGVIEDDEPIEWYLPAQNQMMSMWINKKSIQSDPRYSLNVDEIDNVFYWTCSEVSGDDTVPYGAFQNAIAGNLIEGEMYKGPKAMWQEAHIRCVRGVDKQ